MPTSTGLFTHDHKRVTRHRLRIRIEGQPLTLAIVGVERGGTSMIAGIIGELGIDLGPRGPNHEDPNFLTEDVASLKAYVESRNRMGRHWGFKLPSAHSSLLDRDIGLRNVIWIGVFRNVTSTIDSLVARGYSDDIAAFQKIMVNYNKFLKLCEADKNVIFVSYERAAANPLGFVEELSALLQIRSNDDQVSNAVAMVTGDGGGYRASSERYHHIEVIAFDGTGLMRPLTASESTTAGGMCVQFSADDPLEEAIFPVFFSAASPIYVTVALEFFNDGFSDLEAYDLLIPASGYAVRLRHAGSVTSVAFGQRGAIDFKFTVAEAGRATT